MNTALSLAIMAACLIFTGWAIANIQHRNAAPPAPTHERVVQQWGVHV